MSDCKAAWCSFRKHRMKSNDQNNGMIVKWFCYCIQATSVKMSGRDIHMCFSGEKSHVIMVNRAKGDVSKWQQIGWNRMHKWKQVPLMLGVRSQTEKMPRAPKWWGVLGCLVHFRENWYECLEVEEHGCTWCYVQNGCHEMYSKWDDKTKCNRVRKKKWPLEQTDQMWDWMELIFGMSDGSSIGIQDETRLDDCQRKRTCGVVGRISGTMVSRGVRKYVYKCIRPRGVGVHGNL